MNENLDLKEILKDCPFRTKLYSPLFGDVEFLYVDEDPTYYPINIRTQDSNNRYPYFSNRGTFSLDCNSEPMGECMLFPSKDQRDWSKFKLPQKVTKQCKDYLSYCTDCINDKGCIVCEHGEQKQVLAKENKQYMKQEEKDLLLKDICARLPYGVMAHFEGLNPEKLSKINLDINVYNDMGGMPLPYLRPMSSMTEEEEREYNATLKPLGDFVFEQEELFNPIQLYKSIPFALYEFFIAHHFDYHGLIPMGLALEAPEGMYNN